MIQMSLAPLFDIKPANSPPNLMCDEQTHYRPFNKKLSFPPFVKFTHFLLTSLSNLEVNQQLSSELPKPWDPQACCKGVYSCTTTSSVKALMIWLSFFYSAATESEWPLQKKRRMHILICQYQIFHKRVMVRNFSSSPWKHSICSVSSRIVFYHWFLKLPTDWMIWQRINVSVGFPSVLFGSH